MQVQPRKSVCVCTSWVVISSPISSPISPQSPPPPPFPLPFPNSPSNTPPGQHEAVEAAFSPQASPTHRHDKADGLRVSDATVRNHPLLSGDCCDEDGYKLPPGSEPPAPHEDPEDFFPFSCVEEMLLADFLEKKIQISAGDVNYLMTLWDAYQKRQLYTSNGLNSDNNSAPRPPFADSRSLFDTIDSIPFGDIPWEGFKVKYDGEIPDHAPAWMTAEYDV
ncbi:hypothetical protein EST38_g11115 [Candolleomyces aberdarensis]|uniref:Uncharacterized protein n=1 Tax=Candolleomyces aberdarensis TaxID=2316362 RepID=A0A4Q2D5M6_9AGAR|nr:hypothetical protein EST38_g11115 [Candolleomyces aberdarensis]